MIEVTYNTTNAGILKTEYFSIWEEKGSYTLFYTKDSFTTKFSLAVPTKDIVTIRYAKGDN